MMADLYMHIRGVTLTLRQFHPVSPLFHLYFLRLTSKTWRIPMIIGASCHFMASALLL
jgi:hypothetical protein